MALKQAISAGLIVDKIHRVVEFNQTAWIAPYIEKNTKMRKNSKNKFEESVYKHMNNSVSNKFVIKNYLCLQIFGKTMEYTHDTSFSIDL